MMKNSPRMQIANNTVREDCMLRPIGYFARFADKCKRVTFSDTGH